MYSQAASAGQQRGRSLAAPAQLPSEASQASAGATQPPQAGPSHPPQPHQDKPVIPYGVYKIIKNLPPPPPANGAQIEAKLLEMQLDMASVVQVMAKVGTDQETLARRQGRILAQQQDLSNSVQHALACFNSALEKLCGTSKEEEDGSNPVDPVPENVVQEQEERHEPDEAVEEQVEQAPEVKEDPTMEPIWSSLKKGVAQFLETFQQN